MAKQRRILVVDDTDHWLERTCAAVREQGHEAVAARSYHEAVPLLDTEPFDALITDNFMETEDAGIELLMRNYYLEQELPSILYTSELSSEHARILSEDLPNVVHVQKLALDGNNVLLSALAHLIATSEPLS